MLGELGEHRLVHDLILDRLPVLAERSLAAPAHPGGDHRRLGLADLLLVGCPDELHRLEVVLARWPGFTLEPDRVG